MTPLKEKDLDCLVMVGKIKAGKQHHCPKPSPPKSRKKIQGTHTIGKRERNHRLCQKINSGNCVHFVFRNFCSTPHFLSVRQCSALHSSHIIFIDNFLSNH